VREIRNESLNAHSIDPRIYALYDEYCHSAMGRREFLRRAGAIAGLGVGGLAMAEALLPNYARAETIKFTDERIHAAYVGYPSPGGTSGSMRGYLVHPAGEGRFPAVLVVHENRGLNPYIEDVARRLAVAGFLAFAPDGLAPVGGYPGNDDDGRKLQAGLDPARLRTDLVNGARFVKAHARSSGKLGATGFCFGGGTVNYLATELGADLQAAVPYYGIAPDLTRVPAIKAALLCHLAGTDERVNGSYLEYEKALKAAKVDYRIETYPGTQHGFHNDSTPRYDEAAAKLSWDRTLAHFEKHLA
jgi:carboxymethylenebutenolidase